MLKAVRTVKDRAMECEPCTTLQEVLFHFQLDDKKIENFGLRILRFLCPYLQEERKMDLKISCVDVFNYNIKIIIIIVVAAVFVILLWLAYRNKTLKIQLLK